MEGIFIVAFIILMVVILAYASGYNKGYSNGSYHSEEKYRETIKTLEKLLRNGDGERYGNNW